MPELPEVVDVKTSRGKSFLAVPPRSAIINHITAVGGGTFICPVCQSADQSCNC